jgi:DNA-binding response OmpR family regulator
MLTAKDGDLDEAEALDTGADDFLSKPFSFLVLVAHLRALLRRGGTARPAVLRVGNVSLDVAKRSCAVDDERVDLTPREFGVLEYLMRRQGDVVPKADILSHVWDYAYEGGENVVEVHVSALRRKIGSEAIETARGGGYRMVTRER